MKTVQTLVAIMLATSITHSQSLIVCEPGANMELGAAAEIFADTISMWGTYSGTRTLAAIGADVSNGWNMLSVPLTVRYYTKSSLYPTATGPAFAFDGSYVAETTLTNRSGYWLKFSEDQQVSTTGFLRTVDTINVLKGWNLVGSISSPVPASSITSTPPGMIVSSFFGYGDSYFVAETIQAGKAYWVKAVENGSLVLSTTGTASPAGRIRIVPTNDPPPPAPESGLQTHPSVIPREFSLEQNYPNPFNPSTVIRYQLPTPSQVRLSVCDLLGRELERLLDGIQSPGFKSAEWNAASYPTGVYLYRLTVQSIPASLGEPVHHFMEVKKMVVVR